MKDQIEIVPGMLWTVTEDAGAPAPTAGLRAPAVPLADAATPTRRPWRYSLPARLCAFGSLTVWLIVSAIALVAGGQLPWPWHIAGPVLMVGMIATIEPHTGAGHDAYFAPCTPSRANTITGRRGHGN